MEPLPSQLVVNEEGQGDPDGDINGKRAYLDDEVNSDKQWDRHYRR